MILTTLDPMKKQRKVSRKDFVSLCCGEISDDARNGLIKVFLNTKADTPLAKLLSAKRVNNIFVSESATSDFFLVLCLY
jgi:hypothetical protein